MAAVGSTGTITTADGVIALRDERYQAPAVGDVIRVTISPSGAAVAEGRMVAATAPTGQWTAIPLAAGFTTPHSGSGSARYRVVTVAGQDRVELQGSVDPPSAIAAQTAWSTALPAGARPPVLRSFVGRRQYTATSIGVIAFEVTVAGILLVFGSATPTTTWFSVDGCYYDL
ncbi:hypothetical protein ACFYX8_35045 [Streptomyces cyaneofuscatus]|uniref:hypothetical protein n=1 Tax=Streptomyces cyaneofuscatus TaxID=66883 RepID=UPI00368EC748